jgi:hypothetical protein
MSNMSTQDLETAKLVDVVMSQAQVFASAWALAAADLEPTSMALAEGLKAQLRQTVKGAVLSQQPEGACACTSAAQ